MLSHIGHVLLYGSKSRMVRLLHSTFRQIYQASAFSLSLESYRISIGVTLGIGLAFIYIMSPHNAFASHNTSSKFNKIKKYSYILSLTNSYVYEI